MLQTLALSVFFCAAVSGAAAENGQPLDLAAFGRLMAWKDIDTPQTTELKSWGDLPADAKCVGVEWNEERDVSEIRARFAGGVELEGVTIQYWFNTWPPAPPKMPTIEDPFDDPRQDKWITAETNRAFTVRATEAASDGQPWAKVEADQERVELPQTGKPLEAKIDAQ